MSKWNVLLCEGRLGLLGLISLRVQREVGIVISVPAIDRRKTLEEF